MDFNDEDLHYEINSYRTLIFLDIIKELAGCVDSRVAN